MVTNDINCPCLPTYPQPLFKPHFPFFFISHFILPICETPFSSQVCSPSSPTMAKTRGAHSYRPRVRQSPTPPAGTSTLGATDAADPSFPASGASPAMLQPVNFLRLRKFSQPGKFSGKFLLPRCWNTCNKTRPKIMRR